MTDMNFEFENKASNEDQLVRLNDVPSTLAATERLQLLYMVSVLHIYILWRLRAAGYRTLYDKSGCYYAFRPM